MRFFIGPDRTLIRQRYSPCDFAGIKGRQEVKSGGSLDFASLLSYNFIYSENGKVLLLSFGMAGTGKPAGSMLLG